MKARLCVRERALYIIILRALQKRLWPSWPLVPRFGCFSASPKLLFYTKCSCPGQEMPPPLFARKILLLRTWEQRDVARWWVKSKNMSYRTSRSKPKWIPQIDGYHSKLSRISAELIDTIDKSIQTKSNIINLQENFKKNCRGCT